MKNLIWVAIVGAVAILLSRKFLVKQSKTELDDHFEAQAQTERINRISATVDNNAVPAISMLGELPWVTVSRNVIESASQAIKKVSVPFRGSDI